MSDVALGAAFRAVRRRRGLRQVDVARSGRVSAATISRIERGGLQSVSIRALRRVADVLEIDLRIQARWRGGELGRLVNARHAALHNAALELYDRLPAWIVAPEVSFAIWGERGVVDLLAWHASSRALLIVELKTELVDPQELVGVMDRRRRLAREIASTRGWDALTVSTWVLFADTRTNRRHVSTHRRLLRTAFPADGRTLRRWLLAPRGRLDALSFVPYPQQARASQAATGPRRIRAVRPSVEPASVPATCAPGGRGGRKATPGTG